MKYNSRIVGLAALGASTMMALTACGSPPAASITDASNTTTQAALQAGQVFWFVNVNSGLVLDVANASTDDAAAVIQWPNNGGNNQKWRTQAGPNGSMELVNVGSGKCLDVMGQSKDEGMGLQQYACNGAGAQPNQLWWFNAVDQGSFSVVSVNSGLVLDVLNQSKDPGATVIQAAA
jgi:endoglucanase